MAISQSERQKKQLRELLKTDLRFKNGVIEDLGFVHDYMEENSNGIEVSVIIFTTEDEPEYIQYYTIYTLRKKLIKLLVKKHKNYDLTVQCVIENGESGEFVFNKDLLKYPIATRMFHAKVGRKSKKFKIIQPPICLWNLRNESGQKGRLINLQIDKNTKIVCLQSMHDHVDPCISSWFHVGGSYGHLAVIGETFEQCKEQFVELVSKGYTGVINIQ